MDEMPFPQYRKGIPKAGLDEVTHFLIALVIAAFPFFFLQMALGNWPYAPLVAAPAAWATFRYVAVPTVRYIFNRLPPQYLENAWATVFFRGGLAVRPDPDPIPFKVN